MEKAIAVLLVAVALIIAALTYISVVILALPT